MLARLDGPRWLRVVGAGRGALHLDLDGFVVTVATRRVPMMANAVAASAGASTGRAVAAGVALAARYLTLGTAQG